MTPSIQSLIAKLEAATEGGHPLSWELLEVIGWTKVWSGQTIYMPPGTTEWHGEGATTIMPEVTTSINAAITLVPERDTNGLYWRVILERKPVHDTLAWIAEVRPHAGSGGDAVAHTASLALCIAALKTRA